VRVDPFRRVDPARVVAHAPVDLVVPVLVDRVPVVSRLVLVLRLAPAGLLVRARTVLAVVGRRRVDHVVRSARQQSHVVVAMSRSSSQLK
jgi:hypothetical protein